MFGFGRKKDSGSSSVAKDRLLLVINQDRMRANPEIVEQLKHDLMVVVMRYIDIDEAELDIKINQPGFNELSEAPALEVNIPIKGWKAR